jgi:hypothetical protein
VIDKDGHNPSLVEIWVVSVKWYQDETKINP